MANSKQVSITRTTGEWEAIEKKFKGKSPFLIELSKHITKESLKVKNKLNESPSEVAFIAGKKIEKRPSIPCCIIDDIHLIALKLNVSPSTVIDRLIINPLLSSCSK